jgi:DNA-binding NtrC family response regulator
VNPGDAAATVTRPPDRMVGDDAAVELPRLIVAFECGRPLCPGLRVSLAEVDEVIIGRGQERTWSRANRRLQVAVADPAMSRLHVRLVRRRDGWFLHDVGSKNGTIVDGVRTSRCTLADGDLIEIGGSLLVYRDSTGFGRDPGDRDLQADQALPDVFRTLSLDLERRIDDLRRISPTQVPVIIVGETGTGKELIAESIHELSGRSGPFVPINCGALPQALIESELFGYRRGAFSGAQDDRIGLARKAEGGTLFLDEVAELPEESQVALLRLLQIGEVRPLGSSDLIKVNVRVVAATHQDLRARIAEGRFRSDLYGRLAGYEMVLPPLRDRFEDIGSLIATLLRRVGVDEAVCTVHPRAALALFNYAYPMNIRELEQALRSAVALAFGREITLRHLPAAIREHGQVRGGHLGPEDATLRAKLIELLRESEGNIAATARALEKAPVQIRRWCRRLGIDLNEYRRS